MNATRSLLSIAFIIIFILIINFNKKIKEENINLENK